jgi:hypothetical protein
LVEYAIVTWVLVVALLLGLTLRIIPTPGGQGRAESVVQLLFDALQQYYSSFYFVLNLPFP